MPTCLRVLVFPCGTEIGLEIHRALSAAKGIMLFGGSTLSDHGEFVYTNYIPDIPHVSDSDFLPEISRLIKEYGIDYIIPAHDAVLLKLAEFARVGGLSCKVIAAPYETCRICCSKKESHRFFAGLLTLPRLYDSLDSVKEWPVFLKPDVGSGSRGTVKCLDYVEAHYHLRKVPDLLIFEYLPGKEYTVDCFTDRYGRLIFCGGRERARITNGISVRTSPVSKPVFNKIAETINAKLKLHGAWFFQLKESKSGELALMEIAPRIAGAMGLYRNLGVNFVLMSLYDAEGSDVKVLCNNYPIIFDRALGGLFRVNLVYKCVYVDWDDCVLRGEKLNLQVVAFLYQCVNAGIDIILLSRHAGDLAAAIQKHRIANVFSSVIHIKDTTPKSVFVKEKESIFIDDSFAERREVSANAAIPVFAPDAVESLLSNWA